MVHRTAEDFEIGILVESSDPMPRRRFSDEPVFGMIIGCAVSLDLDFENVQKRNFFSVTVTSFAASEAVRNLSPDQPYPFSCEKADPRDTAMVMLIGISKANNTIESHGVTYLHLELFRDDE
jgi:hypothetical protein